MWGRLMRLNIAEDVWSTGDIMKLLFHMGSHKTGTTSLQSYLSEIAPQLSETGILYPRPKTEIPPHSILLSGLMPEDDLPRIVRFSGSEDQRKARKTRALEVLRKLAQRSPEATLLLSSEEFFTPIPEQGLSTFKQELMDAGISSFSFIAYLRRPSAFYVSWLQQVLKASFLPPKIAPPPYEEIFTPYLKVFGEKAVQLRLYPEVWPQGDDTVQDFFREVLGREGLAQHRAGRPKVNQSLSAESIALMQSYRFAFLREQQGRYTSDSRSLGGALTRLESETETTKIQLKQNITRYIDLNIEALLWVRDHLSFVAPDVDYSHLEQTAEALETPSDLRELIDIEPEAYRVLAQKLLAQGWANSARLESRLAFGLDPKSRRRRLWLKDQIQHGYAPPNISATNI